MTFKNMLYGVLLACCIFAPLKRIQAQTEVGVSSMNFRESQRLSKLLEEFFEDLQRSYPEFATYAGLKKEYNAFWTDHSEEGYLLRDQNLKDKLQTLHTIDREKLSLSEQLNYDLFEKDLKEGIEGYLFQTHYMPLDQLGGIPLDVESTLMMMPRETKEDYEDILARLSGIPILIDQTLDLLEYGLEKNLTQPQIALRTLLTSLAKMIPSSLNQSVFFQPFINFPENIDEKQQELLAKHALECIDQLIYPAYKKLCQYLEAVYIPACRQTVGAANLPNGAAFYQYCVKKHTTTTLTPWQIHRLGLAEVERIQGQMQEILKDSLFPGSMADYFDYLNHAPVFFYTEPESLIDGYKTITRYIDEQLPLLFGHLPKLPYEVVPVPAFSEEGQVGAYYMRGSLVTGRPGRFFVNTYDIGTRPKWQMESLSLHEAVPGHHFQISLAQEIEQLPEFRKYNNYTAYIEGWGLYAESLGRELGLYKTPSNQFGRCIEEMWRAVRLVVDTGMHALGWSREQSIAYMMEKTGMSEREVTTEIDRYIVWPGQALAYKIGELSIQKWRQAAQLALGDAFDIRAFHDMLLEQGALPLDVCENYVQHWVETQVLNGKRLLKAGKGINDLLQP